MSKKITVIPTELAQIAIDDMETLMKSVSSIHYARSNVKRIGQGGGRPTKYNDQLFEMAMDYVKGAWLDFGDAFPSTAGLASYLSITRETVHQWKSDGRKPEFKKLVDIMLREQERTLLNHGSTGQITAQIAKLILYKHGYAERKEVSGVDGKPIETRSWTSEIVDPAKIEADHLDDEKSG